MLKYIFTLVKSWQFINEFSMFFWYSVRVCFACVIAMKRVSFTIDKIIGTFSPTLALNVEIKNSWNKLVGNELAEFTTFHDSKYTGKNELSVIVKVISSASILVRYHSAKIIENLSNLTGISKIKLIFQHASFIPKSSLDKKEIRKIIFKEAQTITDKFKNTTLKNALELLKTEMQNAA